MRDLMRVNGTVKVWEDRLSPYGFLRIHRSIVLNPMFKRVLVRARFRIGAHEVLLRDCPDRLPVGEKFKERLHQ